ncbi:MAG TPA: hypothetical protein VJP77_09760 [Planctomycetota bacterium]|nr:hypothetical protein [Planctomycetota bacterium]
MNQQHDLEALKAALKEAKAIHREAMKAVDGAKRAAIITRCRVGRAQSAYIAALPPSKRPKPRPARVEESVFPSSGEVA